MVVVVVAASALAQSGAVQTFNSPTHGYSVSVPADWQRAGDAEVQQLLDRVHESPNTQSLEWDAIYRAPAPASAMVRYPYVIFQVQPYPSGNHPTEADFDQAVSAMSGNNVKKEASQTGDAFIKDAIASASIGQAKYDRTTHVLVQDLNMDVPGVGPVQGVLVHHFGQDALVSVMCYDRKENFAASQATFDQIASSFKFDASASSNPFRGGLAARKAVLLGVLLLLMVAAVVITIVVLAMRRRPAPVQQFPPFPGYPQYPPQYPPPPPGH